MVGVVLAPDAQPGCRHGTMFEPPWPQGYGHIAERGDEGGGVTPKFDYELAVGARQPLGLAHAKAFTHSMLFSLTPQTIEVPPFRDLPRSPPHVARATPTISARSPAQERRWMDPKMRLQYCLNEFNTHEGL